MSTDLKLSKQQRTFLYVLQDEIEYYINTFDLFPEMLIDLVTVYEDAKKIKWFTMSLQPDSISRGKQESGQKEIIAEVADVGSYIDNLEPYPSDLEDEDEYDEYEYDEEEYERVKKRYHNEITDITKELIKQFIDAFIDAEDSRFINAKDSE